MFKLVKPALSLFIICLVAGIALSFANGMTKDQIVKQQKIAEEELRVKVLNTASEFEIINTIDQINESAEIIDAYSGLNNGNTVGYVFNVLTKGYGGDLYVTIGIDTNGKITGVELGKNNETPGLGTKAGDPGFKSQFSGKSNLETLNVVKSISNENTDIEAISGATITSDAVTLSVNTASHAAKSIIESGVN